DAMKGEMLEVLRRYLEIDERGMDVHFENAERQFALLATIPVREVRTHDAIALARLPAAQPAGVLENGRANSDPVDPSGSSEPIRPPQRRRRRRRPRAASPAAPQPELPSDQIEGSPPPPG
ncbi:MAG TPA: cell division topological specificity factor MinE, partial [Candidatus Eremiobacteraceae bacterium]